MPGKSSSPRWRAARKLSRSSRLTLFDCQPLSRSSLTVSGRGSLTCSPRGYARILGSDARGAAFWWHRHSCPNGTYLTAGRVLIRYRCTLRMNAIGPEGATVNNQGRKPLVMEPIDFLSRSPNGATEQPYVLDGGPFGAMEVRSSSLTSIRKSTGY